jgi:AmmeMemoRadiSam system protein B
MTALECPRLRPHLTVAPEGVGGIYVIWDPLRLADRGIRVTPRELMWLRLFDGRHTLHDIHAEAGRRSGGRPVPLDEFVRLARALDDALFLDGPRFRDRLREYADNPVRPPACLGTYGADADALRRQLEALFIGPGGPGRPGRRRPDGQLRAALVPHIDYPRGGRTYAWGFRDVIESTPAALFVIVGTAHYSQHRFTLTRKHFRTPLGVAPTDQAYIDRLAAHYGDGLFDDELPAHLPEHSIELEVVFLQYLLADRPFRIVPLLVGPFQDCVEDGRPPTDQEDVARMIAALRAVERETAEPVCYLISGDLAHIGPKFGDPRPLTPSVLTASRRQDHILLRHLGGADGAAPDPAGFFRAIADEGNARRVCGLSPVCVVLEALRPGRGRVLHYDQYAEPDGYESVSFASVVFDR